MSKESSSSSGIGFFGLLTILFIALKLTHYIDWSWWWVLAPSWMPLAIIIIIGLIWVAVQVVKHFIKKRKFKK